MSDRPNTNAAYRLLMLLEAALRRPHEHTQLRVWADVFQVQDLLGRQQKNAVVTGIILMYKQLDRIVEQVKAAGHPETTYSELATLFDGNVSPEFLNHPWKDFSLRLAAAKYPLTIINNFLPDEENPIDPKEFNEVREELDKLEKSLTDKDISPEIRNFVKAQIETIRQAMWEYQFRGAEVFQDAILQTYRDYMKSDVVAKHENDPPVRKMATIWGKLMKTLDTTVKVQGGLNALYKIYQLAETVGLHHHVK